MRDLLLIDAICRVEQAKATLSVWLEATDAGESDRHMICAVMSLLEGVAEAMEETESELADAAHRALRVEEFAAQGVRHA